MPRNNNGGSSCRDLTLLKTQPKQIDICYFEKFILQLKLGHLSLGYFHDKFGVDPVKRFAAPLQRLKDWGFLSSDGDQVRLNREGLLQVDRLLHEFFLPHHRTNRYV